MGFISFNENYYRKKLEKYEQDQHSDADIYEAKQLLKVLDDLADEGYTNLNDCMEEDFSCLTRLREVIHKNGAEPFLIDHERLSDTVYDKEEYELEELLGKLLSEAGEVSSVSGNPFLEEIYKYSEWIGYDEDTAYVFLMRDALLPYMYFCSKNRDNLYPWLISRKFMREITDTEDMDDDIRIPLYMALEKGNVSYDRYFPFCREEILESLDEYPQLKKILTDMLGTIKQKRIVVIESGYMGTIPMMLAALDSRVDFRLFTTAPFLYDTYRDKIFCRRYEDIRKFETMYSQDLFMQYSSWRDGKFYVNVTTDDIVRDRSLAEIKMFLNERVERYPVR